MILPETFQYHELTISVEIWNNLSIYQPTYYSLVIVSISGYLVKKNNIHINTQALWKMMTIIIVLYKTNYILFVFLVKIQLFPFSLFNRHILSMLRPLSAKSIPTQLGMLLVRHSNMFHCRKLTFTTSSQRWIIFCRMQISLLANTIQ